MPQDSLFSIVSWKRQKSGDIIVTFDFARSWRLAFWHHLRRAAWFLGGKLAMAAVHGLVGFFNGLDAVMAHRMRLVVTAGLGMGLGLGMTLAVRPAPLMAEAPTAVVASPSKPLVQIVPQKLIVPDLEWQQPVSTVDELPQVVSTSTAALQWTWQQQPTLGQAGNTVIGGGPLTSFASQVAALELGSQLQVVASNQGVYLFQVIEIKTIPVELLAGVVTEPVNQPRLLLVTAPNYPWTKEATVVVASPFSVPL